MKTKVSAPGIDELRLAMSGEVITADDPGYEDARKVWNGDIDRRPVAVAKCNSLDDVRAALGCGRASELPIAVRSG